MQCGGLAGQGKDEILRAMTFHAGTAISTFLAFPKFAFSSFTALQLHSHCRKSTAMYYRFSLYTRDALTKAILIVQMYNLPIIMGLKSLCVGKYYFEFKKISSHFVTKLKITCDIFFVENIYIPILIF